MYADADQKAAWKHVDSGISIDRKAIARRLVAGIRGGGLFFRHRPPVHVFSHVSSEGELVAAFEAMHTLHDIADLTLLITIEEPIPVQRWHELFDRLPMGRLEKFKLVVSFATQSKPALVESMQTWLPRMTRLHTLSLDFGWVSSSYGGVARAICSLDHLTDLSVSLPYTELEPEPAGVMMALVDCAHLTRLSIWTSPLDTDLLERFILNSRSAAQLRCLVINSIFDAPPPSGDCSACFAAMPQLEELVLGSFDAPPVAFLRHAHHAASLRVIQLECLELTPSAIEDVRQIFSATRPTVHLRVGYDYDSPAAAVQELMAIDSNRITCQSY